MRWYDERSWLSLGDLLTFGSDPVPTYDEKAANGHKILEKAPTPPPSYESAIDPTTKKPSGSLGPSQANQPAGPGSPNVQAQAPSPGRSSTQGSAQPAPKQQDIPAGPPTGQAGQVSSTRPSPAQPPAQLPVQPGNTAQSSTSQSSTQTPRTGRFRMAPPPRPARG